MTGDGMQDGMISIRQTEQIQANCCLVSPLLCNGNTRAVSVLREVEMKCN